MNYRVKILILLTVWIGLVFGVYFYGLDIVKEMNSNLKVRIAQKQNQLNALVNEQESYNKASKDLSKLEKDQYNPTNFFSKDVTLINEIKTLEKWKNDLGVELKISGVAGTINTLPKAKTITSIAYVPYGISLTGNLTQAVNFLEMLENSSFVSNISSLSISAASEGKVILNTASSFYLQK